MEFSFLICRLSNAQRWKYAISNGYTLYRGFKISLELLSPNHAIEFSLGPVWGFVCVSFTRGNLNCFRVK